MINLQDITATLLTTPVTPLAPKQPMLVISLSFSMLPPSHINVGALLVQPHAFNAPAHLDVPYASPMAVTSRSFSTTAV